MQYKTVSDIPELIRFQIKNHYKQDADAYIALQKLINEKNALVGSIPLKQKEMYVLRSHDDLCMHDTSAENINMLCEISKVAQNISCLYYDLANLLFEIGDTEKRAAEVEAKFNAWMKENGFDMQERMCDEGLYDFIHGIGH